MTSIAIKVGFAAFAVAVSVSGAALADCRNTDFEGVSMTVCEADPTRDDIRIWQTTPDGEVFGTFERVAAALIEEAATLGFAMNGGMYHPDRSPVGHLIDAGGEIRGIVTTEGPGNFGMLPNGVFCMGDGYARIVESRAYAADPPDCLFATQSGPLLVIEGDLHPRFIPNSDSQFVRNGVGVTENGQVVAAISNTPVNFHRFARFFRDALGAPNALYLDGKVSRLYAPELGRNDIGFPMGPILGTVVPAR